MPDPFGEEFAMFSDEDLVSRYSRATALADGALVDVTATAREAGFRVPVALTRAAWERCVAVPPGVACQDEVLFLLDCAIGRQGGRVVRFGVHARNDNRERSPPLVALKAVCGPGRRRRAGPDHHAGRRGLSPPERGSPAANIGAGSGWGRSSPRRRPPHTSKGDLTLRLSRKSAPDAVALSLTCVPSGPEGHPTAAPCRQHLPRPGSCRRG